MGKLLAILLLALSTHALAVGTVTGGAAPASKPSSTFRATDSGMPILGVRNDADATLANGNLKYSPLNVDASGKLKIVATIAEQALGASGGSVTGSSVYKMAAGVDASNVIHPLRTSTVGEVIIYAPNLPLPTGAATEATLQTVNTTATAGNTSVFRIYDSVFQIASKTPTLGQQLKAQSQPVTLASDQGALAVTLAAVATEATLGANGQSILNMSTSLMQLVGGASVVDRLRYAYATASVVTTAYTQIKASLAGRCDEVDIFDSSGQTLVFALGGVGAESDKFYVVPGGNGRIRPGLGSGLRASLKAVSNPATAGEFTMNCYRNGP